MIRKQTFYFYQLGKCTFSINILNNNASLSRQFIHPHIRHTFIKLIWTNTNLIIIGKKNNKKKMYNDSEKREDV
jgi:predicted DNA-binding protein YlxM (UPF0122 family)